MEDPVPVLVALGRRDQLLAEPARGGALHLHWQYPAAFEHESEADMIRHLLDA
jgi:hypothetical protein